MLMTPGYYVESPRFVPKSNPLLTPYEMGPIPLEHRVVLAPLTRTRAVGSIPSPATPLYYRQRTTAGGLLISEATVVGPQGYGYPNVPGIFTKEQVEAWKPIVEAVKEGGGTFFMQVWHTGRASHPEYQPNGELPIGPSAVAVPNAKLYTPSFQLADYPMPRALAASELPALVEQFAAAAETAVKIGCDGVELHAANGYLIDQFLKAESNLRTDEYGGSIENRCRFPLQVIRGLADAVGPERVGVRLSPYNLYLMGGYEPDVGPLYTHLLKELDKIGVLYVHMIESRIGEDENLPPEQVASMTLDQFHAIWPRTFIRAGGYGVEDGINAIQTKTADLIAYGRYFLSTPDLPERIAAGRPLNAYDRNTFYTPDPVVGYTDYPFLQQIDKEPSKYKLVEKRGIKVYETL